METIEVKTGVGGITAHLDIDFHAGQAWCGLRVQLGRLPGQGHQQVHPQGDGLRRRSSAYRRRQERQQAARNGATAVQANEGIDAAAEQESGDMDGDAAAAQASGDVDSDAATSEW